MLILRLTEAEFQVDFFEVFGCVKAQYRPIARAIGKSIDFCRFMQIIPKKIKRF